VYMSFLFPVIMLCFMHQCESFVSNMLSDKVVGFILVLFDWMYHQGSEIL